MTRIATTLASAAMGLAFALLSVTVANRVHLLPNFPIFAGEDDSTLRAEVYFFVVCPAFVVLGAALGLAGTADGKAPSAHG